MLRAFAALLALMTLQTPAQAQSFGLDFSSNMTEQEFTSLMTGGYTGFRLGLVSTEFNYSMCCAGPGGRRTAGFVGGHAGANWPLGASGIVGLEAGVVFQNIVAGGIDGVGDWNQYLSGDLRARFGQVSGDGMTYVVVGTQAWQVSTQSPGEETDSATATGWLAGVGYESRGLARGAGFPPDWTGRVEIIYASADQVTLTSGFDVVGGSDNIYLGFALSRH